LLNTTAGHLLRVLLLLLLAVSIVACTADEALLLAACHCVLPTDW
jgi:hypothetical protein